MPSCPNSAANMTGVQEAYHVCVVGHSGQVEDASALTWLCQVEEVLYAHVHHLLYPVLVSLTDILEEPLGYEVFIIGQWARPVGSSPSKPE